jgi:putative transposase
LPLLAWLYVRKKNLSSIAPWYKIPFRTKLEQREKGVRTLFLSFGSVFVKMLGMGRPKRVDLGGYVYHVLNRGNGRAAIFRKDGDYEAFVDILGEALDHVPGMRLLSYCLMPNHWHLVLWPTADGELADFVHWLTLTHTQRWHAHYRDVGAGHLYQGRYKSFPVAEDDHYFTVCRYVERNALRAGMVERAEAWRWGSLARRRGAAEGPPLSEGPLAWPANWLRLVNQPQTEADLAALRRSVQRGQPFGSEGWVRATAAKLQLESTLTARGRPKKDAEKMKRG